jgi:predicted nucleotidyltransferase
LGPIEGWYVTFRGSHLAVKGLLHPEGSVVAVLAWRREPVGFRRARGLFETYAFLKEQGERYLLFDDQAGQVLPVVPLAEVESFIEPQGLERLKERSDLDARVLRLVEAHSDHGVEARLTGSMLLGLHTELSDADLVVYSAKQREAAVEALKAMRAERKVELREDQLVRDITSRRADSLMTPEEWLAHERRKVLMGSFEGMPFSVKAVHLLEEHWERRGSSRWRSMGEVALVCEVVDDEYSKDTPNMYRVRPLDLLWGRDEGMEVEWVESVRSRFAEQAVAGETVLVVGRLEVDLKSWRYRVFLSGERTHLMASREALSGMWSGIVERVRTLASSG